jgi:hypothetical protein
MNIDRQTPIGKAVESPLSEDDRPEVEGHRRIYRMQEDAQQTGSFETDNESTEVEGHRHIHRMQEDVQDAEDPEVEGHLRKV